MNSFSLLEERSSKGVIGLQNIGNTCFMNSVIQCLSNTKLLLEYILKDEYQNDIKNSSRTLLMKKFADLIKNIWADHRGYLNPAHIKNAISIYAPRFSGYSQHDAQEFFRYLLAGLHEDLNQARQTKVCEKMQKGSSISADETWQKYLQTDNSKIVHIFGGLLRSTLKCTVCSFTSTVFEPFWDLSLSIPTKSEYALQQPNLNHCLDFFTKEEILEGNERPTCAQCKSKQVCTKRMLIEKVPQVLVIQLKRFSNGGLGTKVETFVDFPVDRLNITDYVTETKSGSVIFNLYGVINHSGSCQFGHYTACCKNPYSGVWHHFNDNVVSQITPDQTKRFQSYILFYDRGVINK